MARKNNVTSPEIKKLVIEAFLRGDSRKAISENYCVKPTTVSMIVKTFKTHGIEPRTSSHRRQKLDDNSRG